MEKDFTLSSEGKERGIAVAGLPNLMWPRNEKKLLRHKSLRVGSESFPLLQEGLVCTKNALPYKMRCIRERGESTNKNPSGVKMFLPPS